MAMEVIPDEDGELVLATDFTFNEIYEPVFTTEARYIDIWGGRAAGRSYFGTSYFLFLIMQPQYFRGCFLRNVYGDIRSSLFQDFKDRLEENNIDENLFQINESSMTVTYLPTGNTIISKGFKKASGNRTGKLKSLAGITHVLVEEADENSEHDVNKLDDSIRTNKIKDIQIIFLHNPPSKNHWLVKRFYNLISTGIKDDTGKDIPYYKAVPKSNPDVLVIFSTYKDNLNNLNSKAISKYESYGDTESPFFDEEYFYVDINGFIPEGARGRIYKNWLPITQALFDSLPYDEYYGLDFGYDPNPVALVKIKTHNNRNFYKEMIYETNLTNPALAAKMEALGVPKTATIYADNAEPKSIQELKDSGYKMVIDTIKGPDSVSFGIKTLQGMQNFATENSKNLWKENEEYKWQLNEEGESTGKPVKKYDHLKDAARGAVVTRKIHLTQSEFVISNTDTEDTSSSRNAGRMTTASLLENL